MKKIFLKILFVILVIIGVGVLTYPTISNEWNTYRQSKIISSYETVVQEMTEEDFSAEWKRARTFNDGISGNTIYADAFAESGKDIEETEYWNVLNVNGDGVMGYISIPDINLKISIYHGTEEDVLQTGAGHLNGTKLPIGGVSTHSVIAAHRGLPSAKLFTDIDQLEIGDRFYVHILDEVLAYEVDQILPMIEKDDMEALESALAIVDGEDHVSLFTCTPYGVNTHRLIVRGERTAYNGEEDVKADAPVTEVVTETVKDYYMIFLLSGAVIAIILILILRHVFNKKKQNS